MAILTDDMKRVVNEQGLGFVATVCADGTPNLSPKGTTAVWDDDHLVFVDLFSPGTVTNLRANPAIEVNIVDPITRTGYRFKGRGEVHESGALFEDIMGLYERQRQMARSRVRHFVVIAVEQVAPLISPAYDAGLSAEEVETRSLRRLEQIYGLRIERLSPNINPPR
jgi:predicted pyridoxine 5'-phosphate oxidase superfamily flavin-nucleotide-binding protein